MAPEEQADLDPEILADPVDDESEGPVVEVRAVEVTDSEDSTKALVPSGARDLAPYDPFRRYMAELRKYPPLSREEEAELARSYRETGDRDALFRLVTANLMLVVRVALSFRRAARNLLDLIQEGNIGLLQAIQRFDPDVGVRLPTYAGWWVRAYMVKFLLDNVRLVRVGTTNARRKLLRNLRREKERLEAQGFEVGTKLLAEHFGVSEVDVKDVEAALASHDVSLDAPRREDQGPSPADVLPAAQPTSEEQVARRELQERAEEAIARFREGLSERDLALLDERILSEDPVTLQAIGDRFGTSREAARQAEARLMGRLKEHLSREMAGAEGGGGPP
jgi:RNA polymerase sigma-32 factor